MKLGYERSLQPPDPKPILGEAIREVHRALFLDNVVDLPISLDKIDKTGRHLLHSAIEEAGGDSPLEDAIYELRALMWELRSMSNKLSKIYEVIDGLVMMEDDDANGDL